MSARKLGLNAVIYGLGGMLNRIISFLLLPLFTHVLSPLDLGAAGMLQILSTFLVSAFSLGVTASLSSCYYRAETAEAKHGAVSSAVLLLVISCGAMLALTMPLSPWLSRVLLDDESYGVLISISLATTALMIVVQPLILSIQYEQKPRLFVSLSAISTIITAGCNIVAVAWLKMGLRGWITSQLIGQAIGLILYAIPFLRSRRPRIDRAVLRRLLLLGLPVMPCFAFMYIIQQGNRYTVEHFHGLAELGIYNLAASLATVSSLAVTAFQVSWTPYFMAYRDKPAEAGKAFGKVTTYYFYLTGLIAACFFAFAQPVVEFMTGPAFHSAWVIVGSLAVANVLAGATNLLTPAQYFSEKLGHLTIMQAIAAAVSVGINAWLIGWLGPQAGGLALALCTAFLLVLHGWWNHRGLSMHLRVHYEWSRLAVIVLSVGGIAALYLVFPSPDVVTGMVRGVAGPSVFCLIVWFLLDPAQRHLIIGALRRFIPVWRTRSP
jgi:O-antigen/teichoic acid export membrane protein